MKRSRGFTLIELLVASFISLLLMDALYQFFVNGGRIYSQGQLECDAQMAAMLGTSSVADELRRSAFATITVAADPATPPIVIAMRDPDMVTPGVLTFNPGSFILYFYDAANLRLMRKIWPATRGESVPISPSPFLTNRRLTAAEIQSIANTPNGTEQAVVKDVQQFVLLPTQFPTPTSVNTFTVTVQISKSYGSRTFQKTVTAEVSPRNKLI